MSTGKYKLQNAARPWLYVSIVDGKIVGSSGGSGVMIEWFANVREDGLATFQAVSDGQVTDDYIYFDLGNQSLILSKDPFFFAIIPSPRAPTLSLIGIIDPDWVWATVSQEQNLPISIRSKDGSTAELWVFEKAPEE